MRDSLAFSHPIYLVWKMLISDETNKEDELLHHEFLLSTTHII